MNILEEKAREMKALTSSEYFDKDELTRLENYFGRKIRHACPTWVAFSDNEFKYFTASEEEMILHIVERRLNSVRQLAARIDACATDEEVMEIGCSIMWEYARSWRDLQAGSRETERAKSTMQSIRSIEVRKVRLVREGEGELYGAIVVSPYYGSVVIHKLPDGFYKITWRTPLSGECSHIVDAMHIKKDLINFMDFIAY